MKTRVHEDPRSYYVVTDSKGVDHILIVKPLSAAIWRALDGWVL